jgi:hypothetical protein
VITRSPNHGDATIRFVEEVGWCYHTGMCQVLCPLAMLVSIMSELMLCWSCLNLLCVDFNYGTLLISYQVGLNLNVHLCAIDLCLVKSPHMRRGYHSQYLASNQIIVDCFWAALWATNRTTKHPQPKSSLNWKINFTSNQTICQMYLEVYFRWANIHRVSKSPKISTCYQTGPNMLLPSAADTEPSRPQQGPCIVWKY